MQALKPVTKPSKQRKALYQAPDHIRYKLFAAPLSKELRASHGVKTLPARTGDKVRVVRGDHKGFEGKITRVDRGKYRIYVEGLTREKVDGTAIFVPVHPSKIVITSLNLDDKWRKKILERKKEARKKAEAIQKPPKEVVEAREEIVEEKVVTEEKPKAKKTRAKKRTVKKAAAKEIEKEKVEAKVEEKPKTRKTRAKRKTTNKAEGGV
jgi:large subunit ribosomal protein L24